MSAEKNKENAPAFYDLMFNQSQPAPCSSAPPGMAGKALIRSVW